LSIVFIKNDDGFRQKYPKFSSFGSKRPSAAANALSPLRYQLPSGQYQLEIHVTHGFRIVIILTADAYLRYDADFNGLTRIRRYFELKISI
jgi:hypothetical protein